MIVLVALAIFQKYDLFRRIRYQLSYQNKQVQKKIPGTREHRLGEYDVQEPEPLPSVDEIVGYLWTIRHDRYFIEKFLEN